MVYKASLLHLQPRQMRLEITDMQNEGNGDAADEDDDVDGLFAPEFAGNVTILAVDFQQIFTPPLAVQNDSLVNEMVEH